MNKVTEDKWVTILGCLLLFCVQFIANMVIVALPSISLDFHLSNELENAINLAFLISSVALMIPLGNYVSRRGIGKYLKISILLMIIGLLLSAASTNIYMLLFSRVIQGIAAAIINSSMYVIVTLQLPSDKLGYVLGLMGSCGYIGLCLSNTISGFIVYYLGWRAVFLILIPLYIFMIYTLIKLDKEWYTSNIEVTDRIGPILYFFFMALFLYGICVLDNNNFIMIGSSLVFLIIFLYVESHIPNPQFDLVNLRNFKFALGNYSAFAMYFMTFIATYILNNYLQYVLGYDARLAGLFLLITPIVIVFVSPLAGKLSDKIDERVLSYVALLFILINVLILFFMDVVPVYMLAVACVFQGIGHGMFSSPNNRFVLTQVSEKDLGNASAVLSTSKDVGKSVSLALFSVIFSLIVGYKNTYDINVSSFILPSKITLAISLLFGLIAFILLILDWLNDNVL